MILMRRLLVLLYKYKYSVYCIIIFFSTLLYFLFRWNIFCSDFQAWSQATEMCKNYEQTKSVGSLCASICNGRSRRSFKCHPVSSTKGAVFSANLGDIRIVFKAVQTDIKSLHWFDNGVKKYPSEREFRSIIQAVVKKKLNVTLPPDSLNSLTHLKSPQTRSVLQREKEMDHLWILVQDLQYLLLVLYSDKNIFPQMLGTCGHYFATEYLEPLQEISALKVDDRRNWNSRVTLALKILEFLEEFESSFWEMHFLCDVKLQSFAVAKMPNKLKIVDVDGIYPQSVINAILSNIHCEKDEECRVFDCRSTCLKSKNKCANSLVNNNIQILCEKIFLGWRLSNTFIIPGLLMSEYTPTELASVLRQCSMLHHHNQNIRIAIEDEIRENLINILNKIEESYENDLFV